MPALDGAVLSIITLFASVAMSLTGFGFGLITMGVYPSFMSLAQANFLASTLALAVIAVNVVPLRRHIRFRLLLPVLCSAAAGVPLGVLLLVRLDDRALRIGLGAVILASLLFNEIATRGKARAPSLPVAFVVGFVSGAFGGAYSVSGPPVTLYLSGVLEDKREIKASLLFYFAVVILLRIPLLAVEGIITPALARTAALLAAPLAVGLALGAALFRKLSSAWVKRLVQVLLAGSAVNLIARALV